MQTYLNNITVLDIAIVAAHLLICICIGFYHLKTIKILIKIFTLINIQFPVPVITISTILLLY